MSHGNDEAPQKLLHNGKNKQLAGCWTIKAIEKEKAGKRHKNEAKQSPPPTSSPCIMYGNRCNS